MLLAYGIAGTSECVQTQMNANAVADQASTFTHLSPQAGGSLSLQEQLIGPSFHSFTSKTTPSLSFTRVVLNVWFTLQLWTPRGDIRGHHTQLSVPFRSDQLNWPGQLTTRRRARRRAH